MSEEACSWSLELEVLSDSSLYDGVRELRGLEREFYFTTLLLERVMR